MRLTISFVIALLASIAICGQQPLNLIPYPVKVEQLPGTYVMKNKMTFSSAFPAQEQSRVNAYLKDQLKKNYNIDMVEAVKGKPADIILFARRMPTSGKIAYELKVDKQGIRIDANFDVAAFYAVQTLLQLLPVEGGVKREIPYVTIFDQPRFDYRGMHLDVGRHFFPVAFIKRYIDYLAYHKFNTFHWHLTEDQGWRIEIKKYPKLTSIGGWRNGTIIGRYPGKGNDNISYGGFYTQEEIKDVVKYASDRFIEVIPEIEMPGHGSAAIAAYPWLSCFPKKPTAIPANMISTKSVEEQKNGRIKLVQETWGVFDDVFCAGNDSTFLFLENVIDEVITLFPSNYFHLGADECPKTHWKQCPRCQQRMKELKLKDEHELQSWFVQRIEKYLNTKGKTLIGWDEILEGGLAPNAVVMSWRGEAGGIEAAKQKHKVIMTPGNPVYFDHTQSLNEDSVTIGGYNPLEKVYAYEPVPKELNEEQSKYVLGAQANVWTEYMMNTRKVEYMIFPRMSALSEVVWSPKENRNWESFEKRLPAQIKRYEKWKANYSKAFFDLKATTLPTGNFDGVLWKLETKQPSTEIKYIEHFAGRPYELKFTEGKKYTTPVPLSSTRLMAAISMVNGNSVSNPVYQNFLFNKATGKKITLVNQPSTKYPGDGPFTLVNGVQNEKGLARSKEFIGFEGTDCEAVIDLGKDEEISVIRAYVFEQKASWIYPPSSVLYYTSDDGINFKQITDGNYTAIVPNEPVRKMDITFSKRKAKYVKVLIKNFGVIPDGMAGAGNKPWLFVDEIEVN
ncbi:MAG TPA: family 20 glycosylhydrolase [Chitinophagaceae bacterium]